MLGSSQRTSCFALIGSPAGSASGPPQWEVKIPALALNGCQFVLISRAQSLLPRFRLSPACSVGGGGGGGVPPEGKWCSSGEEEVGAPGSLILNQCSPLGNCLTSGRHWRVESGRGT